MRLAVFGLGKLGCPMMAAYADAGNSVIGYDPINTVVESLRVGKAPIEETCLQTVLDANRANWSVTSDPAVAVYWADLIFVIVPTPSGPSHRFINDYVFAACRTIGTVLATVSDYKTVVIVSTVMTGSMDKKIIPTLEHASGNRAGTGFGVAYNPEFIALGSVIHDMRHPDFVLIGANDDKSGAIVSKFHESFHRAQHRPVPQICLMSCVNAELAKLSVNAYLGTKIAYANQLARLCGQIPGSDADVICRAIGNDMRIGGKYLKPAVPAGGPCLPRDSRALIATGDEFKTVIPLAEATVEVDALWLQDMLRYVPSGACRVVILGRAYKPDTTVSEASAGGRLAEYLTERGYSVTLLGSECASVPEADVVFVTTPHPEFTSLVFTGPTTVVDCWRIMNPAIQPSNVTIIYPGKGLQC